MTILSPEGILVPYPFRVENNTIFFKKLSRKEKGWKALMKKTPEKEMPSTICKDELYPGVGRVGGLLAREEETRNPDRGELKYQERTAVQGPRWT